MPKHLCKFIEDLRKKCICFVRGPNQFKPQFKMCIPRMFVSVAIKGVLDLEAYLKTVQYTKNV